MIHALRDDELRAQRHRPRLPRRDEHRRQHGVAVGRPAASVLPDRAVLAADLSGVVRLRAVQRDQAASPEAPERRQEPGGFERLEDRVDGGEDGLGRHRVEQRADVRVGGHLVHQEERAGVALPARLLHRRLVREERGRLREEHREGPQRRVHHRIARVPARAPVVEPGEDAAELRHQGVERRRRAFAPAAIRSRADVRLRLHPTLYTALPKH